MDKNLKVINQNGQLLVDSREVAEMIGKPHDQLMRSIRTYIEYMESAKMQSQNFFISSTYLNLQNKIQPCYLLTRKGCDMVANKMTGEKGVLFTAAYVTEFEEMERQLNNQQRFNLPQNYKEALIALVEQVEVTEKLIHENQEQQKQIQVMKPKSDYYDSILQAKGLVSITDIAKDYGLNALKLNKILSVAKVQYKQSKKGKWRLYDEYAKEGYAQTFTHYVKNKKADFATSNLKWTQKGRVFIHNLLSDLCIVPVVDQVSYEKEIEYINESVH
nr:phage antirepressor KilAC domain-containing protein [Brevibacillus laterosporus]